MSELLRDHVAALHDMLPPEEQKKHNIRRMRTERHAGEFIAKATSYLRQGQKP
jgi:hypothetical protein